MKIDKMFMSEKFKQVPLCGQLMVYTRNKVDFECYNCDSIEAVMDMLKQKYEQEEILECHMFNDDMEYRAISSTSYRYSESGFVDVIEAFVANNEDVYVEEVLLDNTKATMKVLNHISYNALGMASVDSYRLIMGGKENE